MSLLEQRQLNLYSFRRPNNYHAHLVKSIFPKDILQLTILSFLLKHHWRVRNQT